MQISSAIAADDNLSIYFSPANDSVKLITVAPVVNPDGLIINMKAGDDLARLGTSGFVFDGQYGTTADINGGAGADTFDVSANGSLTVGGLTTIKKVETVRVTGTFDANGGLNYIGTTGNDTMLYSGIGTLNVSGGNFQLSTLGGDDTFTTKVNSTIVVDGADAIFNGGAGANTFTNNGHVATLNGGNILIDNFQNVTNNGNSFDAAGNFTYDGGAGSDTFTNNGALNAGGFGLFDMKGGGDIFANNGTIVLVGDGTIKLGGASDFMQNAGTMTAANWMIDGGGGNFDQFFNGGTVTGGSVSISGLEFFQNDPTGSVIATTGGVTYTGTVNGDIFNNVAGGVVNSNTTLTVNMGAGLDAFTNGGRIIVQTGDANISAGSGAGSQFFNGGGAVIRTKSGNVAISGFQTNQNFGTIDASGNIGISGTGLGDLLTNTGTILAGGNGNFVLGAGTDTFQNVATINLGGAGIVSLGGDADGFTNDGSMTAASWAINGGGGLDTLTNNGLLTGGTVDITNTETVTNSGTIRASTGGVTYAGTAGVDSFTNDTGGVVNSATALSFDLAGGSDLLETKAGSLIVVQAGNATFEGGAGVNTFINSGEVTTKAGDIVISNFSNVTNNNNTFDAAGNFTYDGTAGADTFTNNGSLLATGTGTFTFGGDADTLQNNATGIIDLDGAGTVKMGGNADAINNLGSMTAASWAINGGGGLDALTNSGFLGGGSIDITNTETVTNTGTIRSLTAGVTYTGTVGADIFTNDAGGIVNSQTALNFDFNGGDDLLETKAGSLIVVQSGNANIDGGLGANNRLLNAGTIRTNAGDILIDRFQTVTNDGVINASGNVVYTGSGLADTFTNNNTIRATGNGSFKGMGGVDTFLNAGLMAFEGNDSLVGNFESATNTGTMRFNTAGNAPGTAFTVNGNFSNSGSGELDVQQGTSGDVIDINGIFTSAASASLMLDSMLTGPAPATDKLTATGVTGTVNLDVDFVTTGDKGLLPGKLLVVDNGGAPFAAGVSINGKPLTPITTGPDAGVNISNLIGGTFDGGFVDYYIRNDGGDVYYQSVLDGNKAGGIAAGLASTVSSISAIFHKPISALVSRCKDGDADGRGFGTWARASGGTLDTNSSGSYKYGAGSGSLATDNQVEYVGLQSGLDMASCDQGSGSTYHFGLMTGYMTGFSNQVGSPDRLSVDFETKYLGAYATLIDDSGFTADYALRYDWHNFDMSHTDPSAVVPGTEVDGGTISSSVGASYTFALSDTTSIRPGVGVLVGRTDVDSFKSPSAKFSFDEQVSIMATANITAQHVMMIDDKTRLLAFVSGSVFNEFGDNPRATVDIFGTKVGTEMDNVGTFGQVGAGLTLLGTADPGSSGPDMTGTLRFDAQFGDRLEGWGVTGQVRLQF